MLQNEPNQRLCIADIMFHPWLTNGDIASAEWVTEEFTARHVIINDRAREEEERKIAIRN